MPRPTLRVLFLTDSLSDLDGVGRYGVCLIKALQELRPELEVHVLLSRKHRPTSSEVPRSWRVEVALPPDYFFYMSKPKFWASLISATWRTWRAARGAMLVHAIKDYPHNCAALLGARMAGIPCIATAHGTYTVMPLLTPRHERLARWCYARFAAFIAVSRFTETRVRELLGASHPLIARTRVVPNAVSAEHFVARPSIGEREWHRVRFTLSIGELKERKGHHIALAAWCEIARRRPELHHFVVGKRGEDDYQRSLEKLVNDAGLTERVHFLGNIDELEKIDLLQRAQVFVHTPVTSNDGGFEGFGIVYLEASASGTPCIGTLGCGAEDAIVDGVTGLLVQPSVDRVAGALAQLLDDAELRERMGHAGREHARACSWTSNARVVLEIYDEVGR